MDLQLHITLYEDEGEPRFRVHAFCPETEANFDVTEQYQVMAAEDPNTGRKGFMVLKKQTEAVGG